MSELNETMICIKMHLHPPKLSNYRFPKPTIEELDSLNNRLRAALSEQSEEMRKY